MSTAVHRSPNNFGDLTPYLSYGPVGDHILHIQQEFNTLYLTRFRTYKIARPPKTKTSRRGGGFRQITTGRKVGQLKVVLKGGMSHTPL
jgi:hypothetical protein